MARNLKKEGCSSLETNGIDFSLAVNECGFYVVYVVYVAETKVR